MSRARRALVAGLLLGAAPLAAQRAPRLSARGLDSLRAVTAVDSVDADAWYRYGLGLWQRRQYDAADSAFRRALRYRPWHSGAHLALGFLMFGRGGRYLFDLPGRVGPDSALALLRDALRHRREGYRADPRADLSALRFLKDDELVPDSRSVTIGDVTYGTQFFIPALRDMRRAARRLVEGQADSAFAILARALARRRADQTMTDQFIELYARAALLSGRPAAAADGYRELARRAGRREAAAAGGPFDLAPVLNSRGLYLLLYGVAELETGDRAVARAAFQEALTTDLTFYEAHARLADLAEAEGDLDAALEERRAAVATAPGAARPYIDLGVTLLQAGRAREAKAALTEAVARLPWDAGAQRFLFQAALAAGDRESAARALAAFRLFAPRRNQEQVAAATAPWEAAP